MLNRISSLLVFITGGAIFWLGAHTCLAQNSVADFHKILSEKAAFEATDFAALERGETVVKLLPAQDKREVAVSGLVRLQVPAEVFLQSFRESMARKSNPAILEIGRFSNPPTLDDLQTLTIEMRDLEDLRDCVVGDCQVKLSSAMIERFHKEISWETPDYQVQATQLFKRMFLEYVRDYLARGDAALIEYHDKRQAVWLAQEHRALMAASGYLNNTLPGFPEYLKSAPRAELSIVENAIVWSKIKFGLKPVIAINHIVIYRRQQETGPQILIASRQIYANHYFDSSLALTAFVNIPEANHGSYLFYENRSRADGLEGMFSKIKRDIVENRAVENLKTILRQSRLNLETHGLSDSAVPVEAGWSWRNLKVRRVHVFLLLLWITAFVALLRLSPYSWRGNITGGTSP
jgi:hypothetical protein